MNTDTKTLLVILYEPVKLYLACTDALLANETDDIVDALADNARDQIRLQVGMLRENKALQMSTTFPDFLLTEPLDTVVGELTERARESIRYEIERIKLGGDPNKVRHAIKKGVHDRLRDMTETQRCAAPARSWLQ